MPRTLNITLMIHFRLPTGHDASNDFEEPVIPDDHDDMARKLDASIDSKEPVIPDDHGGVAQEITLDYADLCKPCTQQPLPLPDVKIPTNGELARHSLTHLPYQRWCKWCVMARMPNIAHRQLPAFSRRTPLLVMDYCFIRAKDDTVLLTVLVAKLYPARAIFAVPCDTKGPDHYATYRLTSFLEHSGVHQLTYMCDQESALGTMMKECLKHMKATGEWVGAVPEHSAVGESQSNGRAERSVQQIEDHIRCFKAELEFNIKAKLPRLTPCFAGSPNISASYFANIKSTKRQATLRMNSFMGTQQKNDWPISESSFISLSLSADAPSLTLSGVWGCTWERLCIPTNAKLACAAAM